MYKPALFAILLLFSGPGLAIHPDVITGWCAEKELADKHPEDATANDHTEAILGYLTAVLDSLHEDNPACRYYINGQQFCSAFKSHMDRQKIKNSSSFRYAREAIAGNIGCSKNDKGQ